MRGFLQREGVDYADVFAPTCSLPVVRAFLAHAAANGWEVRHADITTAFLNGDLLPDERIYVELPPQLGAGPGKVGLLKKALYGL